MADSARSHQPPSRPTGHRHVTAACPYLSRLVREADTQRLLALSCLLEPPWPRFPLLMTLVSTLFPSPLTASRPLSLDESLYSSELQDVRTVWFSVYQSPLFSKFQSRLSLSLIYSSAQPFIFLYINKSSHRSRVRQPRLLQQHHIVKQLHQWYHSTHYIRPIIIHHNTLSSIESTQKRYLRGHLRSRTVADCTQSSFGRDTRHCGSRRGPLLTSSLVGNRE